MLVRLSLTPPLSQTWLKTNELLSVLNDPLAITEDITNPGRVGTEAPNLSEPSFTYPQVLMDYKFFIITKARTLTPFPAVINFPKSSIIIDQIKIMIVHFTILPVT